MKKMKKIVSLMLALVMCMSLSFTAFGATGEGYEITIANATAGESYSAYKIFDATYSESGGVSYTIDKDSVWYETISSLTVVVEDGQEAVPVFTLTEIEGTSTTYYVTAAVNDSYVISALQEVAIPEGATATTARASDSTLTLDVGEPGYYYVTTTNGGVVSITTAAPAATIIDKNNPPSVEKDIVDGLITGEGIHGDTEAIGDDVSFEVVANAPLYYAGDDNYPEGFLVLDYVFTDHMSAGLEIQGLTTEENANASSSCDYYIVEEEVADDTTGVTTTVTHYYATNQLINTWVKVTDGTVDSSGNEVTYNLTEVAYNVVLELTEPTEYVNDEGETVLQFDGFTLSYDTVEDKDGLDGTQYGTAAEIKTNYPANAVVTIDYTAHVTGEVKYDNTNEIDMIWHVTTFKNPGRPLYEGEDKDYDDIYVLGVTILKVDGSDSVSPLNGATFQLTGENLNEVVTNARETYTVLDQAGYIQASSNNTELWFELVSGGYTNVSPYDLTDEDELAKYVYDNQPNAPEDYHYVAYTREINYSTTVQPASGDETKTVTGTTDENGVLSFEGLTVGTWTLTEIVASDGYNLLDDSYTFTISVSEWQVNPETNKVVPVWSITSNDESDIFSIDSSTGIISVTIENNAGAELPGTGGMGTTIFYVIGIIVVAGAAILLVTRRRMNRAA